MTLLSTILFDQPQPSQASSFIAWVVVIAAAVGGLISIISVVIQNWFLAKRQREQLSHDAEQRRVEREMALRREVYLEVAGATAKLQEYLLNLGNPNISAETQAEIMQGSSAALNRAQVVGTIDTLQPLNRAQEFFAVSSIDLSLKGVAVKLAALKVTDLEKESEFLFNNRMEFAKTILAQKDVDVKQLLETLGGALEGKEKEIKEQLEEARNAHRAEIKKLLIASVQAGLGYNNLLIEPLIMARRELGFEIDPNAYREMSEAINARLQQEIEKSVVTIEGMFEDS
jgi:hypothetical protein